MIRARKPGFLDGLSFTIAVTAASRTMILRDRLMRRVRKPCFGEDSAPSTFRHSIRSREQILDAVFVTPSAESPRAALLICHGIGETVDHWLPVQHLLAGHGIASLVFDYAGYGRSTGTVRWEQCENDAVAAFEFLQTLVPAIEPSIMGFSMGSGVAAAILDRTAPHRLILCAAFTSFQAAAGAVGIPKRYTVWAPPIWDTLQSLGRRSPPALIIHGGHDRLFPQQMASDLAGCCGVSSQLVIVPGLQHNEPFRRPRPLYWNHVVRWLLSDTFPPTPAAERAARFCSHRFCPPMRENAVSWSHEPRPRPTRLAAAMIRASPLQSSRSGRPGARRHSPTARPTRPPNKT